MSLKIFVDKCSDCPMAFDENCLHPEGYPSLYDPETIPLDCPLYFRYEAEEVKTITFMIHDLACRENHLIDSEILECSKKFIKLSRKIFAVMFKEFGNDALEEFKDIYVKLRSLATLRNAVGDVVNELVARAFLFHSATNHPQEEEEHDES